MVMMMRGRKLRQLSALRDDDDDDEEDDDNEGDHYYDYEDEDSDTFSLIILLLLLLLIVINILIVTLIMASHADGRKRMINIGISERVSRMFSGRTYGMPFISFGPSQTEW